MNITEIQSSYENATYSDNVENTFENVTILDDANINNLDASFFSLPVWLFITMISISTWIIVANSTVLFCLVTSRNALKNNVNVQLLSLSLTDLLVGITTIPGIFFPILFQNTKYETCALMMYLYIFSQSATICHTLLIGVNRLLAIKRKTNVEDSFTTIVLQILAVWGCCFLFSGIHLLSFARFGETVERCSSVYLFGDNELVAHGSLTIPLLIPPQLCTNIIYAYLIIFIRRRSRMVGVLKAAPKQTTNVSALAASSLTQESQFSKSKTLGDTQATQLPSVDTTGHASSSSAAKTMVQTITHEPQAIPSTASESKCKEDNAKTMVQTITHEPEAIPSTASESKCKEDNAKTMVQTITHEPEAIPSTASESKCKEDNAKTMVQSITHEPQAIPSTASESKCKEDNAKTMVQTITHEPEAIPSTASESKCKEDNAKTMVQSITHEPQAIPSTASESKCKEDNAKTMVQTITHEPEAIPSTASESKCKEDNAKTMVQTITHEPEAIPSTASESKCKEDNAKTMVQTITHEPQAIPSTASESKCKEDNAKTMVQSITHEPEAIPSTASESKCKEDNAKTMVQTITHEPEAGPSTASESKCKEDNAKTMVQSITHEPEAGPSKASESKGKGDNHMVRNARTPTVNTYTTGGNKAGNNQTKNSRTGWEKQKRAMVTFGILLMSLNIFMTPYDFITIIQWMTGPLSRGVRFLFITMAMLNSAFNPLINIWRIRPFRLIMKEKLTKIYESLSCRRT